MLPGRGASSRTALLTPSASLPGQPCTAGAAAASLLLAERVQRRLSSMRGAARSGDRAEPRFPRARLAGGGNHGCWSSGRRAKAPPGVAAGVRIAAGERRGRNGPPEPWAADAGFPRRRPRSRRSGFLAGLLLGPPESVAKDPGDAVSQEPFFS